METVWKGIKNKSSATQIFEQKNKNIHAVLVQQSEYKKSNILFLQQKNWIFKTGNTQMGTRVSINQLPFFCYIPPHVRELITSWKALPGLAQPLWRGQRTRNFCRWAGRLGYQIRQPDRPEERWFGHLNKARVSWIIKIKIGTKVFQGTVHK